MDATVVPAVQLDLTHPEDPGLHRSFRPRPAEFGDNLGVARDAGADGLIDDAYAELRRVADRYVRRERVKSVQATELVHEAYLKLARDQPVRWQNRAHFVAIAAIAMRRLLVERARRRGASKRGGGQAQVTLEEGLLADAPQSPLDLVMLDRALSKLASVDPEQARIVELRYFGGLSVEETAEALAISPATVKRHWTIAKAWLLREIEGAPSS